MGNLIKDPVVADVISHRQPNFDHFAECSSMNFQKCCCCCHKHQPRSTLFHSYFFYADPRPTLHRPSRSGPMTLLENSNLLNHIKVPLLQFMLQKENLTIFPKNLPPSVLHSSAFYLYRQKKSRDNEVSKWNSSHTRLPRTINAWY